MNYNNNINLIFTMWDKSITLCREFVKSTILFKHKDTNITELLLFILNNAVKIMVEYCCDKPHYIQEHNDSVFLAVKNDKHIQQCLYNMLVFFSECYEKNPMDLHNTLNSMCRVKSFNKFNRMICLICFYYIKDVFLIDNRLIYILEYNKQGKIIEHKTYEEIVTHTNYVFTARYNKNPYRFIRFPSSKTLFITSKKLTAIVNLITQSNKPMFVNKL